MVNGANILLTAGLFLAALYAVAYVSEPSAPSGAFLALPNMGIAAFAVAIVVLAGFALWQGRAPKKKPEEENI